MAIWQFLDAKKKGSSQILVQYHIIAARSVFFNKVLFKKLAVVPENSKFSNVQKITSAEKLRSRAFDEIVPFRKFIIKDDTSALL